MSKNRSSKTAETALEAAESLAILSREAGRSLGNAGTSPPPNPLAQDPQLIQDFLVEAREHLGRIESHMMEIEGGTANQETLHGVFRSFHTIKGLAGFLDFDVIQEVAHEVETLLDKARIGELTLTPDRVDVILQAGDYVGAWLAYVEASGRGAEVQRPASHAQLVARLKGALTEAGGAVQAAQESLAGAPEPDAAEESPSPAAQGQELAEAAQGREAVTRVETSVVKVATLKLEYLVDMVGELVIAQSMLHHSPDLAGVRTPRLQRDIAQLARVTAEVQKTAMAMRMVQIGALFRKMSRLVRDLGRKSGKKAELELIGEDVELDRTLVEELGDPLVHMIRNSMDHGLETPAERAAAGKPPVGRIRLAASHQAGQIVIEVADDGRGLNRARIIEKAISRGVIGPNASLSEQEAYLLVFQPGFSTAEKVTDVSGRGVGMDVVRKQVEKLRGRIEVESALGKGTRFRLRLPLTLAIIEGLVVGAGGERYIVPLFAVREMFRAAPETIFTVEGRGEMAMVRERLLPVVRLARELGLPETALPAGDGLMIVGESEGKAFCLLVDGMMGKQEVVIKSLGPAFRHVRGISGGAILGDGRVGLILDIAALVSGSRQAA